MYQKMEGPGLAARAFDQLLRLGAAPTLCCTEAVGVAGGGADLPVKRWVDGFVRISYRKK